MATHSDQRDNSNQRQEPSDTPGRPKAAGSRQQTQPNQVSQSGSPEQDAKSASKGKANDVLDDVQYRDRPADEGKHGDGDQEPNPRRP